MLISWCPPLHSCHAWLVFVWACLRRKNFRWRNKEECEVCLPNLRSQKSFSQHPWAPKTTVSQKKLNHATKLREDVISVFDTCCPPLLAFPHFLFHPTDEKDPETSRLPPPPLHDPLPPRPMCPTLVICSSWRTTPGAGSKSNTTTHNTAAI
jgi:hypothetical protein